METNPALVEPLPLRNTTDDAPRSPSFARRMLIAGLGLGLLAEVLFDGNALGVSAPLFTLACIGALRLVGGIEGWQAGKRAKWLLASAVFFSTFIAIRASETMAAINAAATLWCGLAALATWRSEQSVESWSLLGLIGRPVAAGARAVPAGVKVVTSTVKLGGAKAFLKEWSGPAIRSVLIAGPVFLVFLGLLVSADRAFAARFLRLLDAMFGLSFATPFVTAMWVACVGLLSAGALAVALSRRRGPEGQAAASAPVIQLGATEGFSLVMSLTALIGAFDAVTIRCTLLSEACQLPDDMTYASYVHRGFAELMVAAGLVLLLLVTLNRRVALKSPGAERAMQVMSSALTLVTLPLVASGVERLQMYESAYGFTVARVLAQSITVLVGVLLVWRGVTLWVAPARFVFGSVLCVFAALSALNVLDVEGFVTKQNLTVADQTGQPVDADYLATLSADSQLAANQFFVEHPDSGGIELHRLVKCTDSAPQAFTLACARIWNSALHR